MKTRLSLPVSAGLLALPLLGAFHASAAAPSDLSQLDFFEKKIRPVLVESCYECHSADAKKLRGGLFVDTREGLLKGGESGPALLPGDPQKSLLLASIRHEHKDPDLAMPPKKSRLPDNVLADFELWIRMGAPDPRTGPSVAKSSAWDANAAASHWAFQKITSPAIPQVADPKGFIRNPIDHFVLARLAEHQLPPSPSADRHTLIRRVTYDLTGLPPTPQEVDAFLSDQSPDAYEKVVDRLLASPQYGERWGRHWLDIARYADTTGDRPNGRRRPPLYAHAWTYRDYVIQAFNKDLPYDRFILEQIAADHLPETAQDKAPLAALGFLTVGKRFMGNENDVLDDRIDVVTKGLMGLTAACARCHDHKFDPIPTRDYYALHGVFASSEEPATGPALFSPEANPAYQGYLAEIAKVEAEVQTYKQTEATRLLAGMLERAGDYLLATYETARTTDPLKKGTNFRIAARDMGLQAEVAAAWLDQVKKAELVAKKKKDPLLGPWLLFAALSHETFASSAPDLLTQISSTPEFNPTLVAALVEKAPQSIKDVAAVYSQTLETLRKEMALPGYTYRPTTKSPLSLTKIATPLADPALETLRKDIFSEESCMMPDERTLSRTLGGQFQNAQGAISAKTTSLELTHPGAPIRAMALADKAQPKNSAVLIRGEPTNRGAVVPRRTLTLLGGDDTRPFTRGSGRLELAQSIVSRDNPLTARVIVNRVWQWHFGQGMVRTVSDFGTRSEPPTHPELLDWLSTWLMDHGWSLKQLHKLILTSATYQQDSRPTDQGMAQDPTNQWLWRFNIQRLDFEQVRDSLLTISNRLETAQIGGVPFSLTDLPGAKTRAASGSLNLQHANPNRRAVYAMVDRSILPEIFTTFDFANPDLSTGERVLTTVPQQALFLMNSPMVAQQVRHFVERPDFPGAGSHEEK
ncbi:MAG: hypothetical protein RLZZ399_2157, partial [Verrucomicrobiota bacterium]